MAGHAVPQWCDSASHQTIKSECRCFCGPSPTRRKAAAAVSPELSDATGLHEFSAVSWCGQSAKLAWLGGPPACRPHAKIISSYLELEFFIINSRKSYLGICCFCRRPRGNSCNATERLGIDGRQRWLTARASDTLPFSPGG